MADPQPSDRGLAPAAGPSGPGALRASHADRDLVVEQLRVAAGDGRLSPEELDERLELALTARTYAELATIIADLPAAGTAVSPTSLSPVVALSAPKDLIRLHCSSGQAERRGRWVVPNRMDLKVSSGHITLDFTQAVITQRTLHIDADVRSGHITLVTRPGIVVRRGRGGNRRRRGFDSCGLRRNTCSSAFQYRRPDGNIAYGNTA
jgi:hypothetical protein